MEIPVRNVENPVEKVEAQKKCPFQGGEKTGSNPVENSQKAPVPVKTNRYGRFFVVRQTNVSSVWKRWCGICGNRGSRCFGGLRKERAAHRAEMRDFFVDERFRHMKFGGQAGGAEERVRAAVDHALVDGDFVGRQRPRAPAADAHARVSLPR